MNNLPFMHKDEYEFITSHLKDDATMLEWGSGGSTLYFPKFVKKYYSIEHYEEWYNKVSNSLKKSDISNVEQIFVPSSPENWDRPKNWRAIKNFSTPTDFFTDYINHVDKINKKFDYILVDGRCRTQCALKALYYLKEDGILFFHDFYPRHQYGYHNVLNFYDEIGGIKHTNQTVVALKKKKRFANTKKVLDTFEIKKILNKVQKNIEY